jgi:hypothetical protein
MSKIQERLARLAHLSPYKRELVLKQLRQKGMLPPVDNNHQQLPMQPVPRQEDFPLSFAQQRLWFLDQLKPGLITYNIPLAMQINGRLNLKVLKKALSEILRRHEALRTNFPAVLGQPVQVIRPAQPLPLPLIDLQA